MAISTTSTPRLSPPRPRPRPHPHPHHHLLLLLLLGCLALVGGDDTQEAGTAFVGTTADGRVALVGGPLPLPPTPATVPPPAPAPAPTIVLVGDGGLVLEPGAVAGPGSDSSYERGPSITLRAAASDELRLSVRSNSIGESAGEDGVRVLHSPLCVETAGAAGTGATSEVDVLGLLRRLGQLEAEVVDNTEQLLELTEGFASAPCGTLPSACALRVRTVPAPAPDASGPTGTLAYIATAAYNETLAVGVPGSGATGDVMLFDVATARTVQLLPITRPPGLMANLSLSWGDAVAVPRTNRVYGTPGRPLGIVNGQLMPLLLLEVEVDAGMARVLTFNASRCNKDCLMTVAWGAAVYHSASSSIVAVSVDSILVIDVSGVSSSPTINARVVWLSFNPGVFPVIAGSHLVVLPESVGGATPKPALNLTVFLGGDPSHNVVVTLSTTLPPTALAGVAAVGSGSLLVMAPATLGSPIIVLNISNIKRPVLSTLAVPAGAANDPLFCDAVAASGDRVVLVPCGANAAMVVDPTSGEVTTGVYESGGGASAAAPALWGRAANVGGRIVALPSFQNASLIISQQCHCGL